MHYIQKKNTLHDSYIFKSLPPDELKKRSDLSKKQIDEAIMKGTENRRRAEANTQTTPLRSSLRFR
jgi:hypothetical protein